MLKMQGLEMQRERTQVCPGGLEGNRALTRIFKGLPWWCSDTEFAFPCRGLELEPW